jgi:hypothetical protein
MVHDLTFQVVGKGVAILVSCYKLLKSHLAPRPGGEAARGGGVVIFEGLESGSVLVKPYRLQAAQHPLGMPGKEACCNMGGFAGLGSRICG